MKLNFQKASTTQDIQNVYEYNIDAFSESPDFNWNLKEIEKEVSEGWDLYAAHLGDEVIVGSFFLVCAKIWPSFSAAAPAAGDC